MNIIVITFVIILSFIFGYFFTEPVNKEKTYKTQLFAGFMFSIISILVLVVIVLFGKISS